VNDSPSHPAAPAEAATRTFPPHANAELTYKDLRTAGLKAWCESPPGIEAANREHCGVWADWIERYGGREDVT
jgi:hypothetical protein